MTTNLISPEQLELAHSHLMPWLGSRSRVTLGQATQATVASMEAANVPDSDRRAAAPRPLATILRLKGFYEVAREGCERVFVRRGSFSAERQIGLAYARAWRERNRATFDALYGSGGKA